MKQLDGKLTIGQNLRSFVLLALWSLSLQSWSSDDYHQHIADLHLHESHQAKNPGQVIRYSDGDEGRLLQAVLTPSRVKSSLDTYVRFTARGEQLPDLPQLLKPLLGRYEPAFRGQPRAYEAEYLDSLDAAVAVIAAGGAMLNAAASGLPAQENSAKAQAEGESLGTAIQALAKSLGDLSALANRTLATAIREKVGNNMFSAEGAKRALALADRIAPPADGKSEKCSVVVMQDEKLPPKAVKGRVHFYGLRDAPFRFQVSSAECTASVGVFLSPQDFQYVADSPIVVTPPGFSMAGGAETQDVLFIRSENPRLVDGFERSFDSVGKEMESLCAELGTCPARIRAFRSYWNFRSTDGKQTRAFADFNRLSTSKPIKGAKGDIPVVVYTKVKDVAKGYSVMETHPMVLRFRPSESL